MIPEKKIEREREIHVEAKKERKRARYIGTMMKISMSQGCQAFVTDNID